MRSSFFFFVCVIVLFAILVTGVPVEYSHNQIGFTENFFF